MPEDTSERLIEEIKRRGLCSEGGIEKALEAARVARSLGVRAGLADILVEMNLVTSAQLREVRRTLNPLGDSALVAGYEILDRIGKGGMGTVYRARQKSLDRIVALKVLASGLAADAMFAQRFQREARLAARMDHPNLVRVYSVGSDRGRRYLAMEYVEGPSVASLIEAQGRLGDAEAADIALGAARALGAIAERGVVHRDIKPSNIILTPSGVPKVTDLGLAKAQEEDLSLTRPGSAVGTPNYISPEQARGDKELDIRSDIYSLGAALYHMVTGRTPFSASTQFETMRMHVDAEPTPADEVEPEVSAEMAAVIGRMMEKDPADRYQSAEELAEALEGVKRALARPAPEAAASSAASRRRGPRRASPLRRRFGLWIVWAAATGAMLGAVLAVLARGRSPVAPPAPPMEAAQARRTLSRLPPWLYERAQVEPLAAWGASGGGAGEFREPSAVAVSPGGTVYVADRWNHRVQFFGPDGEYLGQWGGEGRGEERFFTPGGLSVDASGAVRVADTGRGKALHFLARGTFVRSWGRPGADRGEFGRPVAVEVAPDGRVFVLEEANSRLQIFSQDGTWLRAIERDEDGRHLFDRPRGLALASPDLCYVADAGLGKVVALHLWEDRVGAVRIDVGDDAEPAGICLDDDGRVYVSDMRNHRVVVLADGALSAAIGGPGRGAGEFARPEGLAWSEGGVLWVADTGNDRIQKLRVEARGPEARQPRDANLGGASP